MALIARLEIEFDEYAQMRQRSRNCGNSTILPVCQGRNLLKSSRQICTFESLLLPADGLRPSLPAQHIFHAKRLTFVEEREYLLNMSFKALEIADSLAREQRT